MKSASIIFIIISLKIFTYGQHDLDSPCIVEATKSTGTCKLFEQCPSIIDDVKHNIFLHTRCVPIAANGTEIVCCPTVVPATIEKPQVEPSFSTISEKMCYKHKSVTLDVSTTKLNVDKCESKSIPPISTSLTKHEEYPHMAFLGYFTKTGDILWLCSGVLLTVKYVLAPAHCQFTEYGGPARARIGKLHDNIDDNSFEDNHLIPIYKLHPMYGQSSAYNDIVLLLLAPWVKLTASKRPACLPSTIYDSEGSKVIFTGLRQDNETGRIRTRLRHSTVEIIPTKDCNDFYANQTSQKLLEQGIKSETQMCARLTDSDSETDSNDSDGVLQVYHPEQKCMFVVIGIASFGLTQPPEDPENPGLYTRIFPYMDWIDSTIWN